MANSNLNKKAGSTNMTTTNVAKCTTANATYSQIAQRAYYIWQERKQPMGRDMEHWLQAERELKGTK